MFNILLLASAIIVCDPDLPPHNCHAERDINSFTQARLQVTDAQAEETGPVTDEPFSYSPDFDGKIVNDSANFLMPAISGEFVGADNTKYRIGESLVMSRESAITLAKHMASETARADSLENSVKGAFVLPPILIVVGGVLLLGAGVGLGYVLSK